MNVLHYATFFDCPSLVETLLEADKGMCVLCVCVCVRACVRACVCVCYSTVNVTMCHIEQ